MSIIPDFEDVSRFEKKSGIELGKFSKVSALFFAKSFEKL